ncbi:MAG: class I SAM-dependent methyltransferase [Candidatus Omnitrophica bacterium]|nr:class I SAM-dependent methyltransferase [Candidatus Omnitrophota bacterium]
MISIKNYPDFLMCPLCRDNVHIDNDSFICKAGHRFPAGSGIIDFTTSGIESKAPHADPDYRRWLEVSSDLLLESYRKGSVMKKIQDYGHTFLESRTVDNGWRLDLGCGSGRHFDFIDDKKRSVGFDFNFDNLKIASSANNTSLFIRGRMEKLPFFDNSFHTIYAIYSLEHVLYLEDAIKEIKRVLVDGGQLLAGLPAEGGILYNSVRKFITAPLINKKYGFDYEKVAKIEHCNGAKRVLDVLCAEFAKQSIEYFPFKISCIHANLIVLGVFRNEKKSE